MADKYQRARKKIARLGAAKMLSIALLVVSLTILLLMVVYGVSISQVAKENFSRTSQARNLAPPGSALISQARDIGTYYSLIDLVGRFTIGLITAAIAIQCGFVVNDVVSARKRFIFNVTDKFIRQGEID